jgi:putative hydrolase of the HAD superfamily
MQSPQMPKKPPSRLTWLFDLDNTLHDASHAIFPAINANMNAYMAQVLGRDGVAADAATVNAARMAYWQRYGATLLGMVKHHQVRAADFLHAAHRFDNLTQMIRAERGLARMLRRLPGRKILLTNAPRNYSREVVRHLGLHRHFVQHIPIEEMYVHGMLRPKPSKPLLRKIMMRERIVAHRCILVEDTVSNLKAAKTLGLHTVWITRYLGKSRNFPAGGVALLRENLIKRPAYVDVKVKSIGELARNLNRLR